MTRLMLACWLLGLLSLAGCAGVSSYTGHARTDVQDVRASVQRAPMATDTTSVLEHLVGLAAAGHHFDHVHRIWAHWTPPTTGSPPMFYRLEFESEGSSENRYQIVHAVWDTCLQVSLHEHFESARGRVAAVDDRHRQGEWGAWSRWYTRGELVNAGTAPAIN